MPQYAIPSMLTPPSLAHGTTPVPMNTAWYTTEELARLLHVDPSTLRRWRTAQPLQGPPFVRLTSRVTMYSVTDIETWLAQGCCKVGFQA